MARSGDAPHRAHRHTGGIRKGSAMTITPTRLPGLRAALIRHAKACLDALSSISDLHAVTVVMACAAGLMIVLGATPRIA
jgi:hypothetical protein